MREERPVAPVRLWNGKKAWLVSRFGDVRKILADKRVSNNILHPGFPLLYEARSAVFKQYDKPPYFHFMDPPQHTENRRMLTQDFSVIRVKEMEEEIQSIVDGTIDEMLAGSGRSADLVHAEAQANAGHVEDHLVPGRGHHGRGRMVVPAAGEVLTASGALRREADVLRAEIDAFLENIRAA